MFATKFSNNELSRRMSIYNSELVALDCRPRTSMKTAFFVLVISLSLQVSAAEIRFESGANQNSMIELYTSEGCNSCPPAEAYLNRYRDNPELWTRYIPLAFHVDYWDHLGWKDRFSKREFSNRQRKYANARRVKAVYTPAFFVNGRNWRPGFFQGEARADAPAVGKLTVALEGKSVSASFEPVAADPGPLILHIAIVGMGLSTDIGAGENAGRLARHEFVVLAHNEISGVNNRWRGTLPRIKPDAAKKFALAAWLSRANDPAPLQAIGGYVSVP